MARGRLCVTGSDVLVIGDSLVKYLGGTGSALDVVSLPGEGVDSVSRWLAENFDARYKLVIVHVGTNDLSREGASVLELYDKLCALRDLLPSGIHICISYLFGRCLSNLPNCWYNLSKTKLVRFNSNVLELNGLLSRSGISILEHGRGFAVDRKLYGGDGLHLSRSGVSSFSMEIARYVQQWRVSICLKSFTFVTSQTFVGLRLFF